MRAVLRRGAAICAAVPLMLMLAVPAAHAEDPADPLPGDGASGGGSLVERIATAAGEGADAPTELSEAASLPLEGGGSLTFDQDSRITATVMLEIAGDEATLSGVAGIAEVDEVLAPLPAATVRVDPARLAELEALEGVAAVIPALKPFVGGAAASVAGIGDAVRAKAPGALLAADTASGDACGPIPIEADAPLNAKTARDTFGVDGTGVTIGIISDSFDSVDAPTSWADDVASGALPGAGNPCGHETPVEIVSDGQGGSDEGRAMAQLVHGIAPGAKLLFADAGASDAHMANNIIALGRAGADIIVDDISWSNETDYQLGFISGAISQAQANGIAYFTSAGNSTATGTEGASAGRPISGWQTTAYRPMPCPTWLVTGSNDPLAGASGYDCLDFDPDAAVETPYDTLRIRNFTSQPTASLNTVATIGEPLFGVTTQYEVRFYEVDPATQEAEIIGVASQFASVYPGASGFVDVEPNSEVRMVVVRTAHDPAARPPAVKIFFMRGGDAIASRAFLGDENTDWVGESVFGHAGDGSAMSVASLDWEDPATLRDYSSLGPGTLLYEPVSLTSAVPAARLAAPEIVDTPNVASVDGTRTTFFGEDEGAPGAPEYRFYGTSAAAPNAAAVAALGLSYAPSVRGTQLQQFVADTARGTAAGGPVNPYASRFTDQHVFGAGIVDAAGLLTALPAPKPDPGPDADADSDAGGADPDATADSGGSGSSAAASAGASSNGAAGGSTSAGGAPVADGTTQLSTTGGQSATPLIVGAAALLLLGGLAIAAAVRRKRGGREVR